MWKLLYGKKSKRNDSAQGEKKDKARTPTYQGLPQVAEESLRRTHSVPHIRAEQQSQTDRDRLLRVEPLQVAEEGRTTEHSPPQVIAGGQYQMDRDRHQGVQLQLAVAMEHSPAQTDKDRHQGVQPREEVGKDQGTEHLSPQISAKEQLQTDRDHRQGVQPWRATGIGLATEHSSPQTSAEVPQTDRGHHQGVQPGRAARDDLATEHRSPQINAEEQPQADSDRNHRQEAQPRKVVREDRATEYSSAQPDGEELQTDIDHSQGVQPRRVAGEDRTAEYSSAQTSAEEHQMDIYHRQEAQPRQVMAERQPRKAKYPATAPGSHISKEHPVSVSIEDLETDDIVIAVMGPTGSGKSTFVRIASGRETHGIGHALTSFTSHVIAIRFLDQESGRHVVLVDTPGFDDTFKSDLDILNMISDWLNSSYKKEKLLSGILYLHRITDNRMAGTPLKNLRVFRKLCGKDALDKVYLTTTMWDEVDPSIGEQRLEELTTDYWRSMVAQGAQVERCRNDNDSAKKIVQQIIDQEAKAVLLQEEMAILKKELKETEAGQELYSQLERLVERQTALLQRIDQERKAASDPSVLTELQKEYNDLRVQIDDRLRQMQQLKLSRLKSLLRFFSRRRE